MGGYWITMRNTFYMAFHEKSMFPISGKDMWVVQRVKHATKNRGSQILSKRYFKTKEEAEAYKRKRSKK